MRHSEDYTDGDDHDELSMEEEDLEDYCKGGYHAVSIGETFKDGRYTILRKLGWGHFSTVWLARDAECERYVALKVVKSAQHYTETAVDEIKLLTKVVEANPQAPGRAHVVQLLDHFRHRGPNGVHVCMVFEVLGENLLSLIKKYKHRGIPEPVVQQIVRQVLLGLDYLHRECGIIHTDLKPENVLVCVDDVDALVDRWLALDSAQTMEKEAGQSQESLLRKPSKSKTVKQLPSLPLRSANTSPRTSPAATGNGSAAATGTDGDMAAMAVDDDDNARPCPSEAGSSRSSMSSVATAATSIPASELNITVKIADLGNACWTDYHFTNDIQTRQYRSPEVIIGAKWHQSADMWSMACMTFELLTGDYLFDPQTGPRYTKDEDHIAQVIELLGFFPKHLALSGKQSGEIFNRRGELRHIHRLRYWRLPDVLAEKYHYPRQKAELLASFLLPMLDLNHEKRASARTMLQHAWIASVSTPASATSAAAAASTSATTAAPAQNSK
ncbi:kinase-like domain-containing protein [Syncephalis pseudoplumigaleata]|uniref:non-specific serine/threonine protein kinase n=1 Tax=Syncephalis pseudoplumigaleata TaxID=1712513 RepID=A0A4P9Z1B4_9FUNG|nr:kinase-like domain-containing protein [Syncephalis pseudoplumigaleata]|eukprot:RKP25180.1 kinase-like domain-containing protein [Syncephalis pseudoplumigaleata]